MTAPSYSQTCEFAETTIKQLKRRDIFPTPINYALWYNYVSCASFALVDEIDKAEQQGVRFDEGMSNYLYNKYVIHEEAGHNDGKTDARKLLTDILTAVNTFSGDNQQYRDQINEHIGTLEKAADQDVTVLAQEIIRAASALRESSEQMHQRLDASRKEVEGLKQHLIRATNEAQRDFLTGLFNRKALDKMLDELIAFTEEHGTALSLLMIDVDHFKKFNDTHGHLIGDEVLKMVAKLLTESLKGKDVVARFGGEEFAVLLPSTNIDNAVTVAESIRRAIAGKELKRRDTGEVVGSVSVSIGVASYHPGSDTVPLFLKRADDALYVSKNKGRNRVTAESGKKAA